jgi:hypothetical protein
MKSTGNQNLVDTDKISKLQTIVRGIHAAVEFDYSQCPVVEHVGVAFDLRRKEVTASFGNHQNPLAVLA